MPITLTKKFLQNAVHLSQCKCPKYNLEEVTEQHFQVEKSISVKNSGAHFTCKILANQDLGHMLGLFIGSWRDESLESVH